MRKMFRLKFFGTKFGIRAMMLPLFGWTNISEGNISIRRRFTGRVVNLHFVLKNTRPKHVGSVRRCYWRFISLIAKVKADIWRVRGDKGLAPATVESAK